MKFGNILLITTLVLVLSVTLGCSNQNSGNQQQTIVTKGDLTVKVSGSGKSSYSSNANLVFSSAGRVEQVLVKKGNPVTKGMVLAKLETDALDLALSQAQVGQAQAQVALVQVQSAQTQADIGLTSAQFNLDRTKAVSDILDEITKAQIDLVTAEKLSEESRIYGDSDGLAYWTPRIAQLQLVVLEKQQKLADLLSKTEFAGEFLYLQGQKYDRLAVEDARIKQLQVTAAEQAVEQAALNVEQARRSLDQANKAVNLAQKQLNDATIIAPFDGIITTINIEEGDILAAPGSGSGGPIFMVDPNSLELDIEVDEIDIAETRLDQKAIIKLDALPETFEGKVTAISTLPIIKSQNSGVVVYEVTVAFSGDIPASVKSGMSATVDIVISEKKDVVLVPNKLIKRDSKGQTSVNMLMDQKIQERQVTTGLTDGSQTEIVNGLNAGDIIINPE